MAKQFSVETIFALKDRITTPVGKIKNAVSAAFTSMGKSGRVLNDVFSGAFAAGIALKGVTALTNGIRNLANTLPEYAARADSIAKTSRSLGLASDSFQKFVYAANKAGVSSDQFRVAYQTLNKGLGNGTLVTALEKIDKGLAAQVKAAPNSEAAFKAIASAMKDEGDAATRTAALTAAFGRQGAALTNMLGDLEEQFAAAEKYGNILTPAQLARVEIFNDTMSRLKSLMQSFGDIIRSSVVQYITLLLTQLQEWAARNRELIQTKIAEFIQTAANFIQTKLVPAVMSGIEKVKELWPYIVSTAKSLVTFGKGVWEIVSVVKVFMPLISGLITLIAKFAPLIITVVAAWKLFNTTVTIAKFIMAAFNITASANPIGLIVLAIAAAIAAFGLLASKVGGIGNAFKVLGQTIMKWVLTPINLMLSAIGALLGAMGHLPFIGDTMKGAQDAVKGFQNQMNTLLTGSESTLLNSGPGFLADPYKEARQRELDNQAAKREITGAATDPELLDAMNRNTEALNSNTGATEDNTSGNNAKGKSSGLNYAAAGGVDIFNTVRYGIYGL